MRSVCAEAERRGCTVREAEEAELEEKRREKKAFGEKTRLALPAPGDEQEEGGGGLGGDGGGKLEAGSPATAAAAADEE